MSEWVSVYPYTQILTQKEEYCFFRCSSKKNVIWLNKICEVNKKKKKDCTFMVRKTTKLSSQVQQPRSRDSDSLASFLYSLPVSKAFSSKHGNFPSLDHWRQGYATLSKERGASLSTLLSGFHSIVVEKPKCTMPTPLTNDSMNVVWNSYEYLQAWVWTLKDCARKHTHAHTQRCFQ